MLLLKWEESVVRPDPDGLAVQVLVKEAKMLFVTLRVCKDSVMCGRRAEEQCPTVSGKWSLSILLGDTVVLFQPDSFSGAEQAQEAAETYLYEGLKELADFNDAMAKFMEIKSFKSGN